jgi:hypothetical protein
LSTSSLPHQARGLSGGKLGILADDDRIVLAEVVSKGARKWEATAMNKDDAERFAARVAEDREERDGGRDFHHTDCKGLK